MKTQSKDIKTQSKDIKTQSKDKKTQLKDMKNQSKDIKTQSNDIIFMTAIIENKTIFLQECIWALHYGLIPNKKLVAHKDFDTTNNDINNLELVDENDEKGDVHKPLNRIFHEETYNEEFVKKHFSDVYEKIQKLKIKNNV